MNRGDPNARCPPHSPQTAGSVHKTHCQASSDVLHSASHQPPARFQPPCGTASGLCLCSRPGGCSPGAPMSHSPSYECPGTTGFAAATPSLPRDSRSKRLQCAVRRRTRSPSPAFGAFRGPKRATTLPKAREAAGPRRGRLVRKVPASSISTSSSPRASEHLYATLCPSESALLSVRARAHTHLHSHTSMHPLTHLALHRQLLHALLISRDPTVKLPRLNFLQLFLKCPPPPYPFSSPSIQPPHQVPPGLTCGIHVGFLQ